MTKGKIDSELIYCNK